MSVQIYKPNSKNQGCACSFSMSEQGVVFINAVRQFSWNDTEKTGSFTENAKSKDNSVNIKLSKFELGGLINAIEKWEQFKMFHSFGENKTAIDFTPWQKNETTRAFGLRITRNGSDVFKLPIEMSEAIVIRQFLIYCLNKIFHAPPQKKDTDSQ